MLGGLPPPARGLLFVDRLLLALVLAVLDGPRSSALVEGHVGDSSGRVHALDALCTFAVVALVGFKLYVMLEGEAPAIPYSSAD